MCKKQLLLLLPVLLFYASLSAQGISPEKSQAIVEQVDLAQAIVNRLIESLNLRESILLESEQELLVKEKILDNRDSNLNLKEQDLIERENYLESREKQQSQIEEISNSLKQSLETSENWHKIKNNIIIVLAVTCIVEGIIIAIK